MVVLNVATTNKDYVCLIEENYRLETEESEEKMYSVIVASSIVYKSLHLKNAIGVFNSIVNFYSNLFPALFKAMHS